MRALCSSAYSPPLSSFVIPKICSSQTSSILLQQFVLLGERHWLAKAHADPLFFHVKTKSCCRRGDTKDSLSNWQRAAHFPPSFLLPGDFMAPLKGNF